MGVYIDSELTFDEHVTNKVRIANALLGQIRRSFSYLDSSSFAKLFESFVRSDLEFSQSVWAPRFKKHIKLLENVQERGTKLVDGFQNLTYNERLRRLKMTTLAYRRMRGDTIEVYKHFHVYDRRTITDTFSPRERVTRRHRFQLREYIPSDGTRGVKSNSFYYRSIRIWNDLPANVVDAESLNEFIHLRCLDTLRPKLKLNTKCLCEEVRCPPPPTILFIPFIHTSLGLSFYLSTCLLDLFFHSLFFICEFYERNSFC